MSHIYRLIPVVCLIAGALLIGSELLDTFVIENPEGDAVATVGAAERHGFAFGLLGLLGILATLLAVFATSRPAAIAVAVCGLAALALFAVIELPDVGTHDLIVDPNQDFIEGRTVASGGFWISISASVLMTVGGVLLASLSPAQLAALRPGRRRVQSVGKGDRNSAANHDRRTSSAD